MKEKRKLRDKINLKMVIPGDHIEMTDDIDLFSAKKIKSQQVGSVFVQIAHLL